MLPQAKRLFTARPRNSCYLYLCIVFRENDTPTMNTFNNGEATMQLISINIGRTQAIQGAKASGTTGIYKLPVEAAQITAEGLADDAICDRENHGGVDQAVYVYGTPDYAWWSAELGRALAPGTFGENLTITDLASARLNVGDRLRIGAVVLEVTAPRIPCVTLATRMGDPAFVKRFRHAERPGLYAG